jgi:cell division protein ZapE
MMNPPAPYEVAILTLPGSIGKRDAKRKRGLTKGEPSANRQAWTIACHAFWTFLNLMIEAETDKKPSEDGPDKAYQAMIAAGTLRPDPTQAAIVGRLQALYDQLGSVETEGPAQENQGLFRRFGLDFWRTTADPAPRTAGIRGLYIHGPVGRGKSMVMDLFFETAPVASKRRVHFHAFMQEVHGRLKETRDRAGADGADDAIPKLADRLIQEASLLCFDEFHVQNIADAMILGRLFDRLFDHGLTMVATSNFPPDRLYENGLNRDRFLPFIERLKGELDVVDLAGPTDYRLERLQNLPVYYCPANAEASAALADIFSLLTDEAEHEADEIEVGSRKFVVPKAARGVAWFDFADLCEQPLGAADYLALTERYHTLIVEGVPALTWDKHNEARRFMTLVDALYECRVNLVISADAEPSALYRAGDGSFEFERTASRLIEMQSRDYIETPPSTIAAADFVPFALTTDLI